MLLPIDQGIEHGPRDFFPNPASKDPDYQFRLAAEAGYSAIACQIGMATKYYPDYAGRGAADPQGQRQDRHPALRRRALDPATPRSRTPSGSAPTPSATRSTSARPRQDQDLLQLKSVREDCDRFGMPLVIWSYPRGEAVAGKGGQNSFYAIDYAARMAMEMGADIVKLNMPKIDPDKDKDSPAPYNEGGFSQEDAIAHCVESAGRALVVLSGGSQDRRRRAARADPARSCRPAAPGVIYGRNVWQREWNEAVEIVEQIKETMLSQRHPHPVATWERAGGAGRGPRRGIVAAARPRRASCSSAADRRAGGRRLRARARDRRERAAAARSRGSSTATRSRSTLDGAEEDVR